MALWPEVASGEFRVTYRQAGPIRTRTIEAGQGAETILFLHGTGGHLETYMRNILAHAERYRVYAIDLIGHGYSTKPDRNIEIADYVRHVKDFLDAIDCPRAHVSGESLGGWVAVKFALAHPDRVAKLVLNTCGGRTADTAALDRLRTLSLKAAAEPNRDNVRKRLEWLMHDPKTVTDDLVESRFRIYSQPGFAKAMERLTCLLIPEIRQRNMISDEELRAIRAPTLVIWTSHDPTGAVEVGERMAQLIPNAKFVVMDGCGHWPQFENAVLFNRLQLDFLVGAMA